MIILIINVRRYFLTWIYINNNEIENVNVIVLPLDCTTFIGVTLSLLWFRWTWIKGDGIQMLTIMEGVLPPIRPGFSLGSARYAARLSPLDIIYLTLPGLVMYTLNKYLSQSLVLKNSSSEYLPNTFFLSILRILLYSERNFYVL